MLFKHAGSMIAAILGLTVLAGASTKSDEAPESPGSISLFQHGDLESLTARAVEARFRNSRTTLNYKELVDYAMSQMMQDRFREAAVLYEIASFQAQDERKRAMAIMLQGQALMEAAYAEEPAEARRLFRLAGDCFNLASRIAPESEEATLMRMVAWACAGDQLELMVAEQDRRRLGLELEGQETALPAVLAVATSPMAVKLYKYAAVKIVKHSPMIMYVIYIRTSELSPAEKTDRLRTMMFISYLTSLHASRVPGSFIRNTHVSGSR